MSAVEAAAPKRVRPGLVPSWLAGPRLQLLNLTVFFVVVETTLDYPNDLRFVAFCVATALVLDAVASRWRWGSWRMPWPSMVGALGATLVVDGTTWWPFVALPALMVASKHLIRFRGRHLFNPNNLAMSVLILVGAVRIGVNDWGAAPQAVALMLVFGAIASSRVDRLDLAVTYLAVSFVVYAVVAAVQGWSAATVWAFAFMPIQVMIALFAITDPATSPSSRLEKVVWATLIVLLGVPATLAGRPEAPVFALLVAAPQRHLVRAAVARWQAEAAPLPTVSGGDR